MKICVSLFVCLFCTELGRIFIDIVHINMNITMYEMYES